jgi:hypothetical protein
VAWPFGAGKSRTEPIIADAPSPPSTTAAASTIPHFIVERW